MLIGILRPVWLFHDPYNDEKSWPRVAAYLLVDTGLPAITTAFAVLFLALLRYVCAVPGFFWTFRKIQIPTRIPEKIVVALFSGILVISGILVVAGMNIFLEI